MTHISFKLSGNENKAYYIQFKLGYPKENNRSIIVNQAFSELALSDNEINELHSYTLHKVNSTTIKRDIRNLTANEYYDYIEVSKHSLVIIYFYGVSSNDKPSNDDFGFGLSLKSGEISKSFISKIREYHEINKRAYTFEPSRGKIHFGRLPEHIKNNAKYTGECNVVEGYSTWGCTIKQIRFGRKKIYKSNDYVMYQSRDIDIQTPYKFFQYISENYLNYNKCKRVITLSHTEFFTCDEKIIKKLENITFVLGDYEFTFKAIHFFIGKLGECVFKISSNINNTNMWVLGVSFMGFFTMNFDYDDRKVRLFSDFIEIKRFNNNSNNHDNSVNLKIKVIYLISIFENIFFFIINIFILLNKEKKILLI